MKQLLVHTEKCLGCKSCELACSVAHSGATDIITAFMTKQKPVRRVHVETDSGRSMNVPVQCRQCREPKCVMACMTGAMQMDTETGIVVNREEKCVGCWMCVMVCPYGTIVPNEEYKKAVKCDQCLSQGQDPACVKWCPTKALQFVSINDFDKNIKHEFLSRFVKGEV